ncbi:MAG: hypothetical protein JNJ83_10880 [Verrucomicrobiaceae bacterium]|nr:hypothetical protein [Verrucomicrobiaceae bacterium]
MPDSIIAKLRCRKVTRHDSSPVQEDVELNAVHADSPINKQWATYTPSASLSMSIDNEAAHGLIQPGKDYIITIREAAEGE